MKTKFFYQDIKWNPKKSEINFVGAFLGAGRGRRFHISGTKLSVFKGESAYLCKVITKSGNHEEETFKILCIFKRDLSNFSKDDIQLIGTNVNGNFMFDKDFYEGMKKVTSMDKIEKVSLSNEARSDNKGS